MENGAKTTTKKKPAAKQVNKSQVIIDSYKEYVLEHGKKPSSIFSFMKKLKMEESEFYDFFNSFEALDRDIWKGFLEETLHILHNDDAYASYSAREKVLSFYFTWIEVLKKNRSFVLLKTGKFDPKQPLPKFLDSFKHGFKNYINDVINGGKASEEIIDRPLIAQRYDELLWWQTLFILQFWIKDDSQGFEKTDVAIEKFVNLVFDLLGKGPLDSILDFGKFLYQNAKI
jgi:hypothetical protein